MHSSCDVMSPACPLCDAVAAQDTFEALEVGCSGPVAAYWDCPNCGPYQIYQSLLLFMAESLQWNAARKQLSRLLGLLSQGRGVPRTLITAQDLLNVIVAASNAERGKHLNL